jgi:hypothetical protein
MQLIRGAHFLTCQLKYTATNPFKNLNTMARFSIVYLALIVLASSANVVAAESAAFSLFNSVKNATSGAVGSAKASASSVVSDAADATKNATKDAVSDAKDSALEAAKTKANDTLTSLLNGSDSDDSSNSGSASSSSSSGSSGGAKLQSSNGTQSKTLPTASSATSPFGAQVSITIAAITATVTGFTLC